MSYCTSAALPAIDGTAALAARPRRLVLIEGGRGQGLAPRARSASAGSLSLLQSARFLACGAFVILAVLIACLIADPLAVARANAAIDELPVESVVVGTGDSLWNIAERSGADAPTSDVVSWIQERNGIEGGLIVPGQTLVVPAAAR